MQEFVEVVLQPDSTVISSPLKRPPLNVVVKQADQLNIAEQHQVNNLPEEVAAR